MDTCPDPASFTDEPATVEFMAFLPVVPYGPEVGDALGTRQEFLEQMATSYGALVAMTKVLRKDERQLCEMAQGASAEAVMALHDWLHTTGQTFAAQAELLERASARVMIGLARQAVASGAG